MRSLKRAQTQKTMNDPEYILESEVAEQSGESPAAVRSYRNGKLKPVDYVRRNRRVFWTKNAAEAFLRAFCLPQPPGPEKSEKDAPQPISHAPQPIYAFTVRRAWPQIRNDSVVEAVAKGENWKTCQDIHLIRVRVGSRWKPGDELLASPWNGSLWKYMGRLKPGLNYEIIEKNGPAV